MKKRYTKPKTTDSIMLMTNMIAETTPTIHYTDEPVDDEYDPLIKDRLEQDIPTDGSKEYSLW